jgi:hypothetical protein
MPEGEGLPKENTSKAWLGHADKLRDKLVNYATDRAVNIGPKAIGLGLGARKGMLNDDHSRTLSQQELQARAKGMELQRKESSAEPAEYKRGGKVRKTGLALVHRGEVVIPAGKNMERKTLRSNTRKSGRR